MIRTFPIFIGAALAAKIPEQVSKQQEAERFFLRFFVFAVVTALSLLEKGGRSPRATLAVTECVS